MAVVISLGIADVRTVRADPRTEARVAVELRLGGQRPEMGGFWPSFALFAAARIARGWSVGLGYDLVRIYPGELCDGDVCGSPILGASLQAGSWWTVNRESWFGRGGALAGITGPGLHPDEDPAGMALELGLDVEIGWSGRHGRVFLFVTPRYVAGGESGIRVGIRCKTPRRMVET